jgi:phospholipid-binding lipoprotein MlaA
MSCLVVPSLGAVPTAWNRLILWVQSLCLVLAFGGCASIPQDQRDPGDRFEAGNRSVYDFNEGLDRVALKPVSKAYVDHIPQPVRTAASNFFDNLRYLDTVLNGFLQGKVAQGSADFVRFGINSTIGILGLFDVASKLGLPPHDEDFGQTLAVWGAGPGEYLVYPLLGPSGVRDTGGIVVSLLTNPIVYLASPVAIPLGIISVVDLRARNEGFTRFRDTAALDPYIFTRESYLQYRQYEIYDGKPPRVKLELFDDPVADPLTEKTVPEPTPGHPAPAGGM